MGELNVLQQLLLDIHNLGGTNVARRDLVELQNFGEVPAADKKKARKDFQNTLDRAVRSDLLIREDDSSLTLTDEGMEEIKPFINQGGGHGLQSPAAEEDASKQEHTVTVIVAEGLDVREEGGSVVISEKQPAVEMPPAAISPKKAPQDLSVNARRVLLCLEERGDEGMTENGIRVRSSLSLTAFNQASKELFEAGKIHHRDNEHGRFYFCGAVRAETDSVKQEESAQVEAMASMQKSIDTLDYDRMLADLDKASFSPSAKGSNLADLLGRPRPAPVEDIDDKIAILKALPKHHKAEALQPVFKSMIDDLERLDEYANA